MAGRVVRIHSRDIDAKRTDTSECMLHCTPWAASKLLMGGDYLRDWLAKSLMLRNCRSVGRFLIGPDFSRRENTISLWLSGHVTETSTIHTLNHSLFMLLSGLALGISSLAATGPF